MEEDRKWKIPNQFPCAVSGANAASAALPRQRLRMSEDTIGFIGHIRKGIAPNPSSLSDAIRAGLETFEEADGARAYSCVAASPRFSAPGKRDERQRLD